MIFDADVLIWALRGKTEAARAIDSAEVPYLSIVTYMEVVRGARDKRDLRESKSYVSALGFRLLPLTEAIGHKASTYIEEYALKSGLGVVDALVAATAVENNLALLTGNVRHYKAITELEVKVFRGWRLWRASRYSLSGRNAIRALDNGPRLGLY